MRQIHRWRNMKAGGSRDGRKGDFPTDTFPKGPIVDALRELGLPLSVVSEVTRDDGTPVPGRDEYHDDVELEDERFCFACRAFVTPIAGACPWCDEAIVEVDLRTLPRREREQVAQAPSLVVVEPQPRKPWTRARPNTFDEDLDVRRRALEAFVATGSWKQAAAAVVDSFASQESAGGSLRHFAKRQGWLEDANGDRRDQRRRGRARRARAAIRRALADGSWSALPSVAPRRSMRVVCDEAMVHEAAWLYFYEQLSFAQIAQRLHHLAPACKQTSLKGGLLDEWNRRGWPRRTYRAATRLREWAPPDDRRCRERNRDGTPCKRYAQAGKTVCVGHDPERREEQRERARRASAAANRDAVAALPLAWWLRRQAKALGSLAAVHRRVEGAISYDALADYAGMWGKPAQRARLVRRSTVDRILEAWGDGTTFEDIYLPVANEDDVLVPDTAARQERAA